MRRLRREVRLPVGRADRDRVWAQDTHQRAHMQQGLLVPGRGLPVVSDGDSVAERERPCDVSPAGRAAARAQLRRAARRCAPAGDRDRRHRRAHDKPGTRVGDAARRSPRQWRAPDRALAKSRPRDLRSAADDLGRRGGRQLPERQRRRATRVRHPRRERRPEPARRRPGAHGRRCIGQRRANGPDGR